MAASLGPVTSVEPTDEDLERELVDEVEDTTSTDDDVTPGGRRGLRALGSLPRRERPPGVAATIGAALLALGSLVVGFVAFVLWGSGVTADRSQTVLYDDLREGLSLAVVPVSGPIEPGAPVALLSVPSLGLERVVVQGSASEQTALGPGLLASSPLPGQQGVSVLVGRRASYGADFADLDRLRTGDRILVTTGQGEWTYVVDVVRYSDVAVDGVKQVASRLTLVTSDPAYASTRDLVVSAALLGKAEPRSTGFAAAPDQAPGQGSQQALLPLALWSQLLLLVLLAAVWAWNRHPRAVVWVAVAPVVLLVVWNVYENAALLLPNTL